MQSNPTPTRTRHRSISRRAFVRRTTLGTAAVLALPPGPFLHGADSVPSPDQRPLHPIGTGQGIHPGRVVWVHDPGVLDWEGPGHGHWYEPSHLRQERVDEMMSRAVCGLTGEDTVVRAWDRLFRHLNQARGRTCAGYRPGEKLLIKPNWVGMIWREGAVDAERYRLIKRQDYMNTAPQMIIARHPRRDTWRGFERPTDAMGCSPHATEWSPGRCSPRCRPRWRSGSARRYRGS